MSNKDLDKAMKEMADTFKKNRLEMDDEKPRITLEDTREIEKSVGLVTNIILGCARNSDWGNKPAAAYGMAVRVACEMAIHLLGDQMDIAAIEEMLIATVRASFAVSKNSAEKRGKDEIRVHQ